jgi:hypothetical protein
MVVVWMADCHIAGGIVQKTLLAAFFAVISLALIRGGRAAWLFGLLAFVPWAGAIMASALMDRPIMLERCFVFAHVGLIGLWGVAWQVLPGLVSRLAFAWLIASTTVCGLCDFVAGVPGQRPPWVMVTESLRGRVDESDVFLIQDYRDLNRFRYYTTQAGFPWLHALARVPNGGAGHIVHRAAISTDEMIPAKDPWPNSYPGRVWWIISGSMTPPLPPAPGMSSHWQQTFTGGGGAVTVVLYD